MGEKLCDCGKKYYAKGKCRSCYEKSRYQPLITAPVPTTAPCTYDAAHQRVEYWRGLAKSHQCAECGGAAEEWSYRNSSKGGYEMTGQRRKRYPNGSYGMINSRWSTNITDYDPLCSGCHEDRDRVLVTL